jgi:hypothetical protein
MSRKVQRLWPGLNPRIREPEASMRTTRPPKPSTFTFTFTLVLDHNPNIRKQKRAKNPSKKRSRFFYIILFSLYRNGRKKTACAKDKGKPQRLVITCEVFRLRGAVTRLNGKSRTDTIVEAAFQMTASHEKPSCKTWII